MAGAKRKQPALRFESVKLDSLFLVLEAIARMDQPSAKAIAQYAGLDPRTAGKLLKNARLIGLIQSPAESTYVLTQPYPFRGSETDKKKVVREAMLRLPLIRSIRESLALGDNIESAMRKSATMAGETSYVKEAVAPIVQWATSLGQVLDLQVRIDTLVTEAVEAKEIRHRSEADERVVFISHSSKDKPFVRKLAGDLLSAGIRVWVDEQQLLIGDPLPDRIAQGLAESDFFLLVVSENSAGSEWVKRELSVAMVQEIEKKAVTVLPIKIDGAKIPLSISDKVYADFSAGYDDALQRLIVSIKSRKVIRK